MSDFISKSRLKWEVEKWYEKEYYSSFNAAVYRALIKIIDKFPSVEPEKCGDCISREATIADLHTADIPDEWMAWTESFINAQPSVEPERPTGKWIMHSGGRQGTHAECSNCGMKNYAGILNYCPDCGAKMIDEQSLKYADNDTALGGLQSAT